MHPSRVLLLCALALSASGCATLAWPEPEKAAALATGIDGAIAFRSDELPDNEAEPSPKILTFSDAARKALGTDARIQAALSRVQAAMAESGQARLLPNPILNVAVRLPQAGGPAVIEASLAADLISLLQRPGRISLADYRLRQASADAVSTTLDVLTETQQSYVKIQALEAQLAILSDRAQLLDRLLSVVRARLERGEGTRLEVTTVESQRAELRVDLTERTRELRESRLKLARLVGHPSGDATWKLQPWTPPPLAVADESAWVAAALEHRPELQAQAAQLAALGVEVNLAKWAFLDGASLGLDAERDGGEWALGPAVSAPIPIFDWGQARRAQAEARRREAMHALTQTRRLIIQEVRQAYTSFRSAVIAHEVAERELMPLVVLRRSDAEAAYKAGESGIVPLILADQDLQAARARVAEIQQQVAQSAIRLQREIGGSSFTPAPTPHNHAPKNPATSR